MKPELFVINTFTRKTIPKEKKLNRRTTIQTTLTLIAILDDDDDAEHKQIRLIYHFADNSPPKQNVS